MKTNVRLLIFAFVLLAVGVVFAYPYFDNQGEQKDSPKTFTVSQQPGKKIDDAIENGTPLYIEFYGKT